MTDSSPSPLERLQALVNGSAQELPADLWRDLQRWLNEASQAEAERRRQEASWRGQVAYSEALLDEALDAFLVVEPSGHVSDANQPAAALLGYPREKLIGLPFKTLIPVEDWARFNFRGSSPDVPRERRMLQQNANPILVEMITRPQAGGRVLVLARDVTERRQVEAARQENEARLQAIVASIDEVVFEFDADGTYINIWTNDESLLGRPRTELLGRQLEEVVAPSEAHRLTELIRRVLYSRQPESVEYPVTLHGQERWFLARVAPVPATTSFVKTALMLARDITERKRAEAQLAQNSAEIAALYRAATELLAPAEDVVSLARHIAETVTREFDFVGCSVLLADEAGTELRRVASAGGFVLAAAPVLEIAGPGLTTTAYRMREAVYAPNVALDPRYLNSNSRTRSELAVPLVAGKHVLGVLDLQSPELDAFSDRSRHIVEVFADNAALALENANLLANLESARAAAETANQLKSMFLANTSHELRTPLAVIMGALDAILNGLAETPAEQTHLVRTAHGASQRLLYLITDLLDIAKIEAGRMDLQLAAVDILPILAEAYMFTRPRAEQKKLTLEMRLPSEPPPLIWADALKVEQIMLNILGNAVKFTEAGTVTVSIATDWEAPRCLVVTVQDTGIGIPPEKQVELFQPFVQVDGSTTRRYGGTGLGLSIARRLTELMGGTLALYSEGAGRGSTFTLRLPLALEGDAASLPG